MKRLIYGFLTAFLIVLPLAGGVTQDRGVSLQQAAGLDSAVGKQWAVFIAINRYQEWPPLINPVRDAKEIRDILNENFHINEVRELYDDKATAAGIRQLLVNLRSQVGKDDSVFVFYAGHGHTDSNTNTGSWIPSDGGKDEMSQTNWLPNIQIRNMLSQLPAKHVFLISDSCFSGDILDTNRGASPQINTDYYKRAYSRVSRQVMTSGASESVPDASEFAMRLKNGLRRAEGVCIDPEYLFTTAGVREVKSTQPLLGVIRGSEHQDGGSFLFFRKQTAQTSQPAQTAQAQPIAPPQPSVTGGSVTIESEIAGEIYIDGQATGRRIKAGGTETISNVSTGSTEVAIKDSDGVTIKAPTVMVRQGQTVTAVIERPIPEGLTFEIVGGKSVTITQYTGTASTVHIPEKIQGLPVTVIGSYVFNNCDKLTSINISSSVTTIGTGAVRGGNSLSSITVDSRNSAFTGIDGVLFDKNVKTIIQYPPGKKGTSYSIPSSVTNIERYVFHGCKDLTNINIPSSVTTIGEAAVAGGENLTSITVDSRNSTFTAVDGVLFDKNIKTIIQYPIGKKGTSYSIPSSVTAIGDSAFWYSDLTGISIPSSVTSIGDDAFFGSKLTNISIPSSVTSIGGGAFSYCYNLTSISIPSSITSIGDYMFRSCPFTSITIPSSVTSIGRDVFVSCNNLTSITIPSSVTSIGIYAFWHCNNLTSITIPSSVTTIGGKAFAECNKLTSVTLSRKTKVGEEAFPASAKITYSD